MVDDIAVSFCRQVRARTKEHKDALSFAAQRRLASVSISVLRMEVDSLVRAIFLLSKPEAERRRLLQQCADGERWTVQTPNGKTKNVTDAEMVDLAQDLHGWTESVYRFGCAFVHLSNFHDYGARDPIRALSVADRSALLKHVRNYHGGPHVPDAQATLDDLMPFVPPIFDKIAENLDCYLKQIEGGRSLGDRA